MSARRFSLRSPAPLTFLVVLAGYVVAYAYVPRTGFWSGDSGCKFIQLEGILESGYRSYSVSWPGRDLDPELAFLPIREPFGRMIDGERAETILGTFTPRRRDLLRARGSERTVLSRQDLRLACRRDWRKDRQPGDPREWAR